MASINEIHLFQEIFSGNTEAYGQHLHTKPDLGETKSRGENWTVKQKITIKQYVDHIDGKTCLGMIPLNKKNEVKFVVIDVDNYDEAYAKKMVTKIYLNNLPLLPFRSKSGGLHLYLFFKSFISYAKIKDLIFEFVPILGLKKEVEIFPKQQNLNANQIGNWINLPYYGGEKTGQHLWESNFEAVPFSIALTKIKEGMLTEEDISNYLDSVELNDCPPCLQTIYFEKDTDKRNDFLFNLCVYLKSKYGEDFNFELHKINESLLRPLDKQEVDGTIIKSHQQRDYSYRCSLLPLNEFCLKRVCKNRKFGVGGDEISELSFEDFIQHKTDPPYYEWFVNGRGLVFFDETDIINQVKFRSLCFRELHILPVKLKDLNWTNIINRALKNIIIKDVDVDEDLSPGSMFHNYLYDYLEKRVHAGSLSQILMDRVFKDSEQEEYLFKVKFFIDFLYNQKNFRYFKITEINNRLKRMGADTVRKYLNPHNKNERVWRLPFKAVSKLKHVIDEGFNLDFKPYEEKKDEEKTMY